MNTAADFVAFVRRRIWLLVVCVVAFPAGAYFYTRSLPALYEASTIVDSQFAPGRTRDGNIALRAQQIRPALVAFYATRGSAAAETADVLGRSLSEVGTLSGRVDPRTQWITLTATGSEPAATVAAANALAEALERIFRRRITEFRGYLRGLAEQQSSTVEDRAERRRLNAIRRARRVSLPDRLLRVVEAASTAQAIAPNPGRNAHLALILALLIGPALMLSAERLDRRTRRGEDVERLTGHEPLVTIPEGWHRDVRALTDTPDHFRILRDHLTHRGDSAALGVLAVTGPLDSHASACVAIGLAAAFAGSGRRVVLADADPGASGLVDILDRLTLPERGATAAERRPAGAPELGFDGRLRVLTAGQGGRKAAGPALSIASLLAHSSPGDIVVLVTPPLLTSGDALRLVGAASAVVPVVRLGVTPRHAVRRTAELIEQGGLRLLGVVVTVPHARTGTSSPLVV